MEGACAYTSAFDLLGRTNLLKMFDLKVGVYEDLVKVLNGEAESDFVGAMLCVNEWCK